MFCNASLFRVKLNLSALTGTDKTKGGDVMLEIFYKDDGQMLVSQSEADLATIPYDKVIWIDLFSPTGEEHEAKERKTATHTAVANFPILFLK